MIHPLEYYFNPPYVYPDYRSRTPSTPFLPPSPVWELYTSQLVYQGASVVNDNDDLTSSSARQEFPTFPITCPLAYALLCGVCLSPNAQERPDLDALLHVLLSMRHAAERGHISPGKHNYGENYAFVKDTKHVTTKAVIHRIH